MQTTRKPTIDSPAGRAARPLLLRLLLLLPLVALGFAWPRIMAGRAGFVERYYAQRAYPSIKDALSSVTSLVPVSVSELVLYGLVLLLAWVIIGGLVRLLRRRIPPAAYVKSLLSLLLTGAVLLNLFYFTWGFLYFREPLSRRMALPVQERSVDELETLVSRLANGANELRVTLPEDADGVFYLKNGLQSTLDQLPEAYAALSGAHPIFCGKVTRAKRVQWSEGLSRLGISGIYIGFLSEPNVNAHQPDLLIPSAAAHEMAHELGIASENEAEFAAYLACAASSDPAVQYAGIVNALIHAGNALAEAAPERYSVLRATYADGVLRDLARYSAYWRMYDGPLADSADRVNDSYLKFNAQESGVKSYGEVVDLLLAYHNLTNH